MSDDDPKKYTTSDYTVLNEHFNQSLARDNEIIRARKAKTFWQNAKSIALILFFIGIAAMFIGKAMHLAQSERIVERIVEIEVPTSESANNNNGSSTIVIDGEEVIIQTDVTHFKNTEVDFKGKTYRVWTRHNYKDPRDKRPYEQSCYVAQFGFKLEMSLKTGEGIVTPASFGTQLDVANAMSITESDLPYFTKYCRYI
mgnify:CR=1 FL=1|tara:strand:- start:2247 stop:2843 length:597 start_codon:yes stop_codon:yes gene_type:complete